METVLLLHSSIDTIEETAEAYVARRLPAAERESYEEHLPHCRTCRDAVATVDEFIQVFRTILGRPGSPATDQ